MAFDPLAAVGVILTGADEGGVVMSGSAFLFRHDDVVVTAGHCVREDAPFTTVFFPRANQYLRVESVERHPSADIAVLFAKPKVRSGDRVGYPDVAFWDGVSNWTLGEQVYAYGYPSEGGGATQAMTPRLFVGHYQRFFEYASAPDAPSYLAGELSFPAPGGLSGSPLFRPGAQQMVTGIVTANYESYAITDSVDEVRVDGSRYQLESRKVISYGLALMLSYVSDWLSEVIPAYAGRSWTLA